MVLVGGAKEWVGFALRTFMTRIPAAWSLSTTHLGGTPTADTKRVVFSYTHGMIFVSERRRGAYTVGNWTHFDDNIDQLGELTLLVVVLRGGDNQPHVDSSGLA